jgi:hypothetical protein
MGMSCSLYEEEGQDTVFVRRLLTTQIGDNQELLPIATHRPLVRSIGRC